MFSIRGLVLALLLWLTSSIGGAPTSNAQKAEVKVIPLESVYCTIPQKGLRHLKLEYRLDAKKRKMYLQPYGQSLNTLVNEKKLGASEIFFVRGRDIADSISRSVGRYPAPSSTPKDGDATEHYWLVAYLGIDHKHNPKCALRSIAVEGNKVIVDYTGECARSSDGISCVYIALVPELTGESVIAELRHDGEKVLVTRQRFAK
jgi:hypothetical protein